MPIYEYRCQNCGEFERMQKISEEPLKNCPNCKGEVQRLVSRSVGIAFKGPGFYKTDHGTAKDRARKINKERQKDNEAILDGDIKSYVKQSEETTRKIQEA
ncbi:MAG: zinc ribbon domain-containing protein [Syntrophomonadaceae bacterium]|jgi:putative FmdB family regulatory protein|nr:zinc ribbon domain-containing protein [Syntrophomonadaceae bacterium]